MGSAAWPIQSPATFGSRPARPGRCPEPRAARLAGPFYLRAYQFPSLAHPVVRRNFDGNVQALVAFLPLRQRDVLEHEKLRRGLELMDEPPDAAIVANQHDLRGELAKLAALRPLGRGRFLRQLDV